MDHDVTTPVDHHIRDGAARAVGAAGMAAIGLIHLLDAPGKLSETPYMFWLYIGLMLAVGAPVRGRSSAGEEIATPEDRERERGGTCCDREHDGMAGAFNRCPGRRCCDDHGSRGPTTLARGITRSPSAG